MPINVDAAPCLLSLYHGFDVVVPSYPSKQEHNLPHTHVQDLLQRAGHLFSLPPFTTPVQLTVGRLGPGLPSFTGLHSVLVSISVHVPFSPYPFVMRFQHRDLTEAFLRANILKNLTRFIIAWQELLFLNQHIQQRRGTPLYLDPTQDDGVWRLGDFACLYWMAYHPDIDIQYLQEGHIKSELLVSALPLQQQGTFDYLEPLVARVLAHVQQSELCRLSC